MLRLRLFLNGTVQGVGFRPFVYRTAKSLGLTGYVINDTTGVVLEVEGTKDKVDTFLYKVNTEKPPLANIYYQEARYEEPAGYEDFEIRPSSHSGGYEVILLPDITTCNDCERELFDQSDRRYQYPFINCTNCGPRFTIIESLPYDRPNTTMKGFQMCHKCLGEYENPEDRRFHAQPNACPACGPHAWLVDGNSVEDVEPVERAINHLKAGRIVSVRGVGGFHLLCDAIDEKAVNRMRVRKKRSDKPFAVMFKDISQVKEYAEPNLLEESLLISPARPIVLLRKKDGVLNSVSPRLKTVGAFLPYSPLHHILLKSLYFPVVATSGNISDEPVVKDNDEAVERLSLIADSFLLHDRPIHRRCDDSVIKVVGDFPQIIRRSRGYVPLPVMLPFKLRRKVIATGAQEKNTFAIGSEDRVILSQHIGDMESPESLGYFEEAIKGLSDIYRFEPEIIVHDLHPEYETTRWAKRQSGIERIAVQHHYAHILSCMAENGLKERVTGVAWDGTGYGDDGTLWGGEFLICDLDGYKRISHFRHLRLIGGEKAIREPRRVALSILFDLYGEDAPDHVLSSVGGFSEGELSVLYSAWKNGINSPFSSSAGRLFDAVASFLNIIHICNYEAEAAMIVEDLYRQDVIEKYSYNINDGIIDWRPLFSDLIADSDKEGAPSRFINTMAAIATEVAEVAGIEKVCLSGGVFQNSPLSSLTTRGLQSKGFKVYTHKTVPANDGGISLGQAVFGGEIT